MGEQLNIRLFEKIQELETKRKKEQKHDSKKTKGKAKGQNKNKTITTDPAATTNKKVRGATVSSLVDEERAINEAYQVLLTEYHKRKAKRRKSALQAVRRQDQNKGEENEIQDAFSRIKKK